MNRDFQVSIGLPAEAKASLARMEQWPAAILRAIARGLDYENQLTIGYAQRVKMSKHSATTLGVITNRLRGSLTRQPAVIDGQQVKSAIGTNVKYAAPHEFGFDGTVEVPAHKRSQTRVHETVTAVLTKTGKIRKRRRTVAEKVGEVLVRAHKMHLRLPMRSFLRSSLVERRPNYERTLGANVLAALAKGGVA